MSEALKRAKKKYYAKVNKFPVEFYPNDQELWEHLQNQANKQGYIKGLIKQDIAKEKDGV